MESLCLLAVLLQDLEPLQEGGVGVVEGREQGVCYGKGQVVLVELNEGRAKGTSVPQTNGKRISLILTPPCQLGEAERIHLHTRTHTHTHTYTHRHTHTHTEKREHDSTATQVTSSPFK